MTKSPTRCVIWAPALLALTACGARTAVDAECGAASEATPPTGFYLGTIEITSDTCQPPSGPVQSSFLISTDAGGVALPVSPSAASPRQDVPWSGLTAMLPGCDSTVDVHILSRCPERFEVLVTETWVDPALCKAQFAPQSPCSRQWRGTFDLEKACPATLDGVTCD